MQNKYKFNYKLEIKKYRGESDMKVSDELHEALVLKKPTYFWKTWRNKIKKSRGEKILIQGNLNDQEAVSKFADFF